ncbi:GDSL esterase/lipase At5g55050-like [Bidens hawaiensis]|uniref:GDSL esterase/lipase At5g55050-like n=1 Tax=Bidens hawaiensis TaxID=980011 RepID=UPI00404A2DE4
MTKSPMLTITVVVITVICSLSLSNAGSPAVFIVGDSLLDVGTNNFILKAIGKAKYPHYGIDFFNSTPSGRFSNGLNMADFIARVVFGNSVTSPPAYLSLFYGGVYSEKRLANAIDFSPRRRWRRPINRLQPVSLVGRENPAVGVNFASSGTAILDINSAVDQALPLSEQVAQVMYIHGNLSGTIGSWKTQVLFAKSPFFLGVGNNDVHFFALFRAKLNQDEYVDSLIQTYNYTLHTLYNLGVRKFGIIGVPYIGCSPLMRVTILSGNCSDVANALARQLNEGIEHMLQDMMASLKGMIYSFGNTYDTLYDLYETPEQFNLTNVRDACCGLGRFNAFTNCHPLATLCKNRDEYLFWDVSHPSQYAVQVMSEAMAFGGLRDARPINWARLVSL